MKGRITMTWNTMTLMQKIAFIVSCIGAVLVVAAKAKPGLFPVDPTYPAIAVFTICEAVVYWKKKRTWACLLIAGAAISLGCYILELMLQ